jgi:hypothetical protein
MCLGQWSKKLNSQSTTIERFHARHLKMKAGQSAKKYVILKATGTGSNKKQKNANQGTFEGTPKRLDGTGRH